MSDDPKKKKKRKKARGGRGAPKGASRPEREAPAKASSDSGPGEGLVRRSTQAIVLCAVATVALIALDLWTKDLAVEHLSRARIGDPPTVCADGGIRGMQRFPGEPHVIIEDYLELRYAENCGAAFGLLDDAPREVRRIVFGAAGVLATVFLFVLFVRGSGGPLFAWSVPLIVSGAVGNLVDRARLEYVVDFIRFHIGDSWEYPTFNVADITITVGVALLVIDGFREERAAKQAKEAEAEELEAEDEPEEAEELEAEDEPDDDASDEDDASDDDVASADEDDEDDDSR